jgi:NAD(P)-dependent dehydrogenase (short-subunit alcohol dehydrogenase family)
MQCSFGREDALLVIAMKAQPLLRDLKMQFTKTATPQPKAAEILCGPMPAPQASAYSASKAAVHAITISLSQELGSRKIGVNSLDPGMVETDGLRASRMDHGAFRE